VSDETYQLDRRGPSKHATQRSGCAVDSFTTSKARLRLWQLISPALPIGAYAYSRGLEYAVSAGWVRNEIDAAAWIEGQLTHVFESLDVPVFARLYRAWQEDDEGAPSPTGILSCSPAASPPSCSPRTNTSVAPWPGC
jgi:UreF